MVMLRSCSLLSWSLAVMLLVCLTAPAHARGGGGGSHNAAGNVHAPTVQKATSRTARTSKKNDGRLDAGVLFKFDLKDTKSR